MVAQALAPLARSNPTAFQAVSFEQVDWSAVGQDAILRAVVNRAVRVSVCTAVGRVDNPP
jgi:hypothetical protein